MVSIETGQQTRGKGGASMAGFVTGSAVSRHSLVT